MAAGSEFSTLRGLVSTLPKGEQIILCLPDDTWAGAISKTVGKWQSACVVPPGVFEASTAAEALKLSRKIIPAHSPRNLLVVDVPSPGAGKFPGERGLIEYHAAVTPLLKKRGIRSLWILRRPALSDRALGALKDLPWFFIDCTPAGSQLYAQCVTARGIYSSGFFLPRRLDLNDPEVRIDSPALPGLAPQGPKGRREAAETVVDLLQEPYREMFRLYPEATVLFTLDGQGRELNQKAAELLGFQAEDLAGLPLERFIGPKSYRSALRALSALRRRKKASGELEVLRKNGRQFSAYFSAAHLGPGRGVVILRDTTTERRRLEEFHDDRKRLTALAEASPLPGVLFSGRRLVHANRAFRQTFSWIDASSGEVTLRDFLGKENSPLARDLAASEASGSDSAAAVHDRVAIWNPRGERREFTLFASRTFWNGKNAWYLTLADVTAESAALQKLRESERAFREICEKQSGPVSILQDGVFAFSNGACAALFGVSSPSELAGKELSSLVAPRDRKPVSAFVASRSGEFSETASLEFGVRRRDGQVRPVEASVASVQYAGSPALLAFYRDMSGLRQAEEEHRRHSRSEVILEQLAHRIHLSLDPPEVLLEGLRGAMKWLGFETGGAYRAEKDGTTLILCANESLSPGIASALSKQNVSEGVTGMVWKTAEPLLLDVHEYPAHIPYKSLFESEGIRSVLYLPLTSGESVNGVILLASAGEAGAPARDAVLCSAIARHTGDALANALRYERVGSSELSYRNAVESITDVVYECVPGGQFVFVSPRVQKLIGYSPEEIKRSADLWRNLIHPDERGEYSRRISNQGEPVEEFELEYRILPKGKASYRWVRDAVRYRRDASGSVIAIHGLVADITQRVESAAAASRESFRGDVLQSLQEGVVVYDRDLRCREWNKGMELITGFRREDVIGKNVFDNGPRFHLADFPDLLNRALAGTPVSSEDVRYVRPGSDDISVLWCRFSPLRENAGAIGGVVCTVTDVTHRKSLERELRESEETLRNVIDTMGDALMISDLQGKVWEVNREFSALTGHPRSEVIGMMFPYPWLIEEEMSRLVVWLAALREKRFLRDFDMTWQRHDGAEVAISLNTTLLRNASGEPVAMLNIARDISERRGLANDLAAKSRQIEMLNRIISTANSSTEFIRIFDVIAAEVRTMTAFDHMSVCLLAEGGQNLLVHATVGAEDRFPPVGASIPLQESVSRLSVAEGRGLVIGDISSHASLGEDLLSARAGMRSEISIPILLNEKILGTFDVSSAQANSFGLSELTYLQPIADQIGALIDRTMLFQRVSQDSAYIHDLLNSIDSVVYTVDRSSVVREVNKAWRDFALLQGTPELGEESDVIGK
ncbi:MAG TPA: PAS domain S-box protein, partial [Bacteroidota bacterium]|nr:PAS domain S-box protein [Bacteroidota bacterium]